MAKILIAGCGDIGTRLAALLHDQDHRVFGLKRNPQNTHNEHLKYLRADINSSEDLSQIAPDFDAIFYMPTPGQRSLKNYQDIYIDGLKNFLSVFSESKNTAHFFFISSTSVYGQNQGEWVDEKSPSEPTCVTAGMIVKGEQITWQNNPLNTVVRFSGIYGPGRERLIKKLTNGDPIQNQPPYYTNRIHQDDCAAVLAFLLKQKLSGRQLLPCYLASDDEPTPLWEVMNWLAEHTENQFPTRNIIESSENQNKRCMNSRLKELGYNFLYPSYREGYTSAN